MSNMKTILLTGANGGIGASIKNKLTLAGFNVIAITQKDADLSKKEAIDTLKRGALSEVSQIDWIICAHGFIDTEQVLENQTEENIEATFRINTLATVYLAQALLEKIPEGGGIIAVSSSAGVRPSGRLAVYSASKSAVNSFMQALAMNRPSQKFFSLCPGPTNTPMRERIAHDAAQMQSPDVIADVVLELVNEESAYASGDIILVKDGASSIVGKL